MNKYTKSPFNYVGNKYKQLPQLMKIFPSKVNNFIDLFTGGADVAINMINKANKVYANDINKLTIDIMREFQNKSIEEILNFIDKRIKQFNLTKTNKENYFKFRNAYNNGEYSTPLDLFVLTRFSYNNNFRFNDKCEMNQAFGERYFNPSNRANTIKFHTNIQNINLSSLDFRNFDITNLTNKDFVYIDPPYLISDAYYNNGAANAQQKWTQKDDLDLFTYLNTFNNNQIKFAMSNFLVHRNKQNKKLIEWINDNHYFTYNINSNYSHCVASIAQSNIQTTEVIITNYSLEEI